MADSAGMRFPVIYKFHGLAIWDALQSNKNFYIYVYILLRSGIFWSGLFNNLEKPP